MKRSLLLALAATLIAAAAARAANPVVVMDTSLGKIKIELFEDKAPITVKNFLQYVDDKHYDDTIFHRVIGKENNPEGRDFMIQGGGFGRDYKEKKTRGGIKNEAGNGVSNERGTLAMARTSDPDSASAQFFINVGTNDFLDRAKARDGFGYAVFGKVIEGMEIVDKIKAVKTGNKMLTSGGGQRGGHASVPEEDVVLKSIRRADK